jgi:5-formyltetrahydrofolate cyclo-ligase
MKDSIVEEKKQWRARCRQIRKALGEDYRSQASQAICDRIGGWNVFQNARIVLAYLPIKSEVDLTALLNLFPEKRWALPRIVPEENHLMVFHPYVADRLIRHSFGMDEPDSSLPVIAPGEIELTLAPGLAFDRRGWRLGYGGGYFDRFLKDYSGISAGITFDALLFDSLPHSPLDVAVQWLVTESGLCASG